MVHRFCKYLSSGVTVRSISSVFLQQRALSAVTEASQTLSNNDKQIAHFRTTESNPLNHDHSHGCRFYTMPEEVKKQLFRHGGIPQYFEELTKVFRETCIMVRSPALEIMHYLKSADYKRPAIRYVIYGEYGCGKTHILLHILHYGFESGFLLIHIPWVARWMTLCKEVSNSVTREGYVDLNLDAAEWLVHFKSQNENLLSKIDLRLSKEYEWSIREKTEKGAPLMELVEFGIKRVKYASQCVVAMMEEIKAHSTQGRCKTLVLIDGFNAFFHQVTKVVTEDKVKVPPSKITLTEAFLEITKFNWCNGAVIVTVDKTAVPQESRESNLPVYLLGKEGFEHLDPFVPICVTEYSDKELESCLDYYIDRRWLQNEKSCTEEGRTELKYMCGMNPNYLMQLCGPL